MTDGAAKTIQVCPKFKRFARGFSIISIIKNVGTPSFTEEAFSRLTSRDPKNFWTSGQWMTERKGGSDVGTLIMIKKPKPIFKNE